MTDRGKKYLSDILRSIELVNEFLSTIENYNEYISDLKTQSAVERQLGIIGEAVSRYDKLFSNATLEHAKNIIGFRNRLIHAYDSVDSAMIWAIVKRHLKPLQQEAEEKLKHNT